MSIVEWLEHYLAARHDEPRIKLRRKIYFLAGGKTNHEFYGCNGCKNGKECNQNYKGIGMHFIITTPKGKDPAIDWQGFEEQEDAKQFLDEINETGETEHIVLCRWCYVDH